MSIQHLREYFTEHKDEMGFKLYVWMLDRFGGYLYLEGLERMEREYKELVPIWQENAGYEDRGFENFFREEIQELKDEVDKIIDLLNK